MGLKEFKKSLFQAGSKSKFNLLNLKSYYALFGQFLTLYQNRHYLSLEKEKKIFLVLFVELVLYVCIESNRFLS